MITLPNLDSNSASNYARQLKLILKLKADPEVKFNLTAIRKCEPFAMLLVGLTIRNILHGKKVSAVGLNEINKYAGSMCFYDFIGVKNIGIRVNDRIGTSKHIPITILNKQSIIDISKKKRISFNDALREYSIRIAKVLSKSHQNTEFAFEYLVREMIRNIFEHSGSEQAYICGQYWPTYDLIEIAIADEGTGLKKSLQSNMNYINLIHDDETAIKYAMMPGVSKSFNRRNNPDLNPDGNSGFGLFVVSELCIALKGTFCLTSGNYSKYISTNIYNDNIHKIGIKSDHSGTAVMMRIRPSYLEDFDNIFDEIITKGENLAKKNSLAFREASRLSKQISKDLL